jgi:hypothetical protein
VYRIRSFEVEVVISAVKPSVSNSLICKKVNG